MKHVRRKIIKRKGKRTKHDLNTSSPSPSPSQLPQHILDQIPPGATLRPSLSSMRQKISSAELRSITAQRMANNILPLPFNLTPQQQQVQNMRNNNDLKESAINQAKQDMINENERKRSLHKQEVDIKRENQNIKHMLDNDKQQFEQTQKLAEEKHKLDQQVKELSFKKQLIESDNNIRQLRLRNDEQLALIEQAKYENEKLKEKFETNDLNNRFNQSKKQYEDLVSQNLALTKAIEKIGTDEFINGYGELIENLSQARAHNRLLNTLKEQREKLIEEQILSMSSPTDEQLGKEYEDVKSDLEGVQAALAEQIKNKQQRQEQMDKLNNLRKYRQNLIIKTDDLNNETVELIKLNQSIGDINDDVKRVINEKVNVEVRRDIEQEKVDTLRKATEAKNEQYIAEEKYKIIASDEYKKHLDQINKTKVMTEQLKRKTQNWNEAADVEAKAYNAELENEAQSLAFQARIDGNDPVEVLKEQITTTALSPSKSKALFNQIAAQSQLASQEDQQTGEIIRKFAELLESPAGEGDSIRAFIEEKGVNRDEFINLLKSSNHETVKDIYNDYQNGPVDFLQ